MIRDWIGSLSTKPELFIEPFAGGGIIGLTIAAERMADKVLMVELDGQISSVWKTILSKEAEWLAEKIMTFSLTPASAAKTLSKRPTTLREKAFQTILKNRIYHGGILANGSGMIKYGENGKGIQSRWYPETLSTRILEIASMRERITFVEGDGMETMRKYAKRTNAVFFIDPPYTAGGKRAGVRLYTHNDLDHRKLFKITRSVAGEFLMTYDNADAVSTLAKLHKFETAVISMKNTHHAKMSELLIGKNLDWAKA
jgi:DNA adenine methylase